MIFRHRKKRIKKKVRALEESMTDFFENGNVENAEGRLKKPIKRGLLLFYILIIFIIFLFIFIRTHYLQIYKGSEYRNISENNIFEKEIIFAQRGNILDRNGKPFTSSKFSEENEYGTRTFEGIGFGNLLGYVKYPRKDLTGNFFRESIEGESGIEGYYDNLLKGKNGSLINERNAKGEIINELFIESEVDGEDIKISIDKEVQKILYDAISTTAKERGFKAGAGAIMDINSGELIALVTHPDFDSNILSNGENSEKQKYLLNKNGVLVNRAVSGLYTPGSTVKPFFSVAAVDEKILVPEKVIVSTGQISIDSSFDPEVSYVFKDWRAHGPIDLFDAIAWSSNVYFYHIGGGYKDFKGLGIERLYFYSKIFALEDSTNLKITSEPNGVVPNPEWKKRVFNEEWRLGDTYNTVIGQYGFQVTPLQLLRGFSSIANGGYLIEPHFVPNKNNSKKKNSCFKRKY